MQRVKIPEIKAVKTDKIYVQNSDGSRGTRSWHGYYTPHIDTAPCFGTVYEHIGFDRDGVPIVREISFSEIIKRFLN